jgi:hypothetical protein
MKLKHTKARSVIAAITLTGSLFTGAHAAVIVNFSDNGGDIDITWSGTFEVLESSLNGPSNNAQQLTTNFFRSLNAGGDQYDNNITVESTWSTTAASVVRVSGTNFGVFTNGSSLDRIYLNNAFIDNGATRTYTVGGQAQISGNTISDLGITSGLKVTEDTTGDTVSVTLNAVPEPSSAILLGLGALGFVSRRKRTA